MSGGAVVMMQNRLMRRFEEAGATDAAHAVTLDELGCRASFVFRRMAAAQVFVPVEDDRFYMEAEAAAEFLRRRRRIALFFVALGILGLVVLLLVNV